MRKFNRSFAVVLMIVASTVMMSSCSQDEVELNENGITEEVVENFKTLGFDVSDLTKKDVHNPLTGLTEEFYVLEGDIHISEEQMKDMLNSDIKHTGKMAEQYRTNALVSQGRTINVIGYTANNANGLDSKMRTALQWAINNYNRINTSINFTLTFGSNFQPFDMVVYRVSGGGGGSAGFPSNGNPNKFIQIQSGTSNFDTNVVEHVITHEIGHSVGLRHTDWFNRSFSCGTGGSEGTAGVGAVLIPGTPSNIDPNSVMLACFSSSEDGEFGGFDVTALETIY